MGGWTDIEPIIVLLFSSPFSLSEVIASIGFGYFFAYIIRKFIRKVKKDKFFDSWVGRMVLGACLQLPILIIVLMIRHIKPYFSWDSICLAIIPTIIFTGAVLFILYTMLVIFKDEV